MCHCLCLQSFWTTPIRKQNHHLSPVLKGGSQTTNTIDHLCEHTLLWVCLSLPVWVYWRCQKHLWHACWPARLSPFQFSSFFFLYPEIWPSGLGLVPLLSFLKISLANCFHIVFRMALASKSLSVFSPCVLSSRFVPYSSQTPPLGTHIQLTSNNAPSHSPCIAIGTSKLITPFLILTHHCPIFLPRCPSGARMGWGGVALRVG